VRYGAGQPVKIGFEPATSLIFDTASGKLIPGAEVRAA
jgi:hypothetical protein